MQATMPPHSTPRLVRRLPAAALGWAVLLLPLHLAAAAEPAGTAPAAEPRPSRLPVPVRAWFQPPHLDSNPGLYPAMTMLTSGGDDAALAARLTERGVAVLKWCYGPNSPWSGGRAEYYTEQCDPLFKGFRYAGVGIDEWDTGHANVAREKDLAAAGYRAARAKWPDAIMAAWVTGPDETFIGLLQDGTLDLAIIEGYTFIPDVGGLTLDAICEQRCDVLERAGLIDRTIVCFGYVSAATDTHGRRMTFADLEHHVRHVRERYPKMPGVAFYGFDDGAPETLELIRQADALAAELYPAREAAAAPPPGPKPLKVLHLTSGGHHDYATLGPFLATELGKLVGGTVEWKQGLGVLEDPAFADGYDAVIYNVCDDEAPGRAIENVLAATAAGKPAVMIHCSIHAFRKSPQVADWEGCCGLRSKFHDPYAPFTVVKVDDQSPIVRNFPARWNTPGDELYQAIALDPQARPLLEATSAKDGRRHVVCWTLDYGKGRVFATTLGHDMKTAAAPEYLRLVADGLRWASHRLPAAAR